MEEMLGTVTGDRLMSECKECSKEQNLLEDSGRKRS